MMQQHLFISEPPSFFIGGRDDFDCDDPYESGDDERFDFPCIKLSPPSSGLAKRRTNARVPPNLSEITEDSSDSGCSLPSSHSSSCGISIWSVGTRPNSLSVFFLFWLCYFWVLKKGKHFYTCLNVYVCFCICGCMFFRWLTRIYI